MHFSCISLPPQRQLVFYWTCIPCALAAVLQSFPCPYISLAPSPPIPIHPLGGTEHLTWHPPTFGSTVLHPTRMVFSSLACTLLCPGHNPPPCPRSRPYTWYLSLPSHRLQDFQIPSRSELIYWCQAAFKMTALHCQYQCIEVSSPSIHGSLPLERKRTLRIFFSFTERSLKMQTNCNVFLQIFKISPQRLDHQCPDHQCLDHQCLDHQRANPASSSINWLELASAPRANFNLHALYTFVLALILALSGILVLCGVFVLIEDS